MTSQQVNESEKSNFTITRLHARQILDSRGNPTVEVECLLAGGVFSGGDACTGG